MKRRAVWFMTLVLVSGALLLPGASSAQQQEPSPLAQAGTREACHHGAMSAEWKRAHDSAP